MYHIPRYVELPRTKKPSSKVELGETRVSLPESDVEDVMVFWAAMEILEEKEKKVRKRMKKGPASVIFILL